MQWPESLLELDFGLNFNMPVEGVTFPRGLQTLCFGRRFNQDVTRVSWPEGLLRVGVSFRSSSFHARLRCCPSPCFLFSMDRVILIASSEFYVLFAGQRTRACREVNGEAGTAHSLSIYVLQGGSIIGDQVSRW